MHVAIEGCCHGELTAIYDSVARYETLKSTKVDLLIICGDFQALRSQFDYASISMPAKYKKLGTFHQYYDGTLVAPVLTIVIGGNHEASNYMWELFHGGWLAPNIYYLGAAGSVLVDGLRISGASGIYKSGDFRRGHHEQMPLDRSGLRSIYHIREYDIAKLALLPRTDEPSVFLSHDWPLSIAHHGDLPNLLRRKPHFRSDIADNSFGAPPLFELLNVLQPDYWFAAHMHVKFAALYKHTPDPAADSKPTRPQNAAPAGRNTNTNTNPDEIAISEDEAESAVANPDEIMISDGEDDAPAPAAAAAAKANPDEIAIDDDDFDAPAPAAAPSALPLPASPRATRFLALDKCGPGKDFLQYLDITTPSPTPAGGPRLTFDPDWLAVTRALHPFFSSSLHQPALPPPDILEALVDDERVRIAEEGVLVPVVVDDNGDGKGEGNGDAPPLEWVRGPVDIGRVQRFWPTAPPEGHPGGSARAWYTNPQTEAFCGMLGLENRVNPRPQ